MALKKTRLPAINIINRSYFLSMHLLSIFIPFYIGSATYSDLKIVEEQCQESTYWYFDTGNGPSLPFSRWAGSAWLQVSLASI